MATCWKHQNRRCSNTKSAARKQYSQYMAKPKTLCVFGFVVFVEEREACALLSLLVHASTHRVALPCCREKYRFARLYRSVAMVLCRPLQERPASQCTCDRHLLRRTAVYATGDNNRQHKLHARATKHCFYFYASLPAGTGSPASTRRYKSS